MRISEHHKGHGPQRDPSREQARAQLGVWPREKDRAWVTYRENGQAWVWRIARKPWASKGNQDSVCVCLGAPGGPADWAMFERLLQQIILRLHILSSKINLQVEKQEQVLKERAIIGQELHGVRNRQRAAWPIRAFSRRPLSSWMPGWRSSASSHPSPVSWPYGTW